MKIYRELYFKGTSEQLNKFVKEIKEFNHEEWKFIEDSDHLREYLLFNYIGEAVDKAQVSIYIGKSLDSGEINVGNIVPLVKSKLSISEYNRVLDKFYTDIIEPYKESGTELEILQPSDDIFDPLDVMSPTALKKLKLFCNAANKSTGSSHPCDQERWFDFICQTFDDETIIDVTTFADFLMDKAYWGEQDKDTIGVMGSFAWDERQSYELASEYESACNILMYYKNTRGM